MKDPKVIYISDVVQGLHEFFELNDYPLAVSMTAINKFVLDTYANTMTREEALSMADLFKKQIKDRFKEKK